MANPKHLEVVKKGAKAIAAWRANNPNVRLDLHGADLHGADLREADLRGAGLTHANLCRADLYRADLADAELRLADLTRAGLSRADLSRADLREANLADAALLLADLSEANLTKGDLAGADLLFADLSEADLSDAHLVSASLCGSSLGNANLAGATLEWAEFTRADLRGARFNKATLAQTIFAAVDLSEARGLESVRHVSPSTLGVDTLFRSKGKIPECFVRGCGVPQALIDSLPALIASMEPIQFYSCFISHSSKDEEFCRRLYSRMGDENLRVWYAPEHIKGGKKLFPQIDEAIRLCDKLLLVLSEASMNSDWVETEIRLARNREKQGRGRVLFPIRVVDFETIQAWQCFDADSGRDLAVEVREYFIPDFSNWKDHDDFEEAFARLMADLRAEAD